MTLGRILGGRSRIVLERNDFSYTFKGQEVTYAVWRTGGTARIQTILFLGTVQIGRLPVWIAQSCPPGTIVVQGAPHWIAKADGSDTHEFMEQYTSHATQSICKTFNLRDVNIIAESQAVPCVIQVLTTRKYRAMLKSIVLLQPLGLNATALGSNTEDRLKNFKQRVIANLRHQISSLVSDRRLIYNHQLMIRTVGFDNPRSNAQYSAGLAYDAIPKLKELSGLGVPIAIICAQNDKLFPAREIEDSLKKSSLKLPVETVPGVPHSPLASRHGRRLLRYAFERLTSLG